MTQQAPPTEHGASATRRDAPATGRLVGLDLARCLAVFGMYVAHVGPDPADGGPAGVLAELTHGRSMALFALLGGVTLVIIGGRPTPKTGRPGRQAAAKVAIRAAILVPLGAALTMTPTDVDVVLAYYGAYFLLALPLIRLRARTLALIAVGWALVGPQLSFVMRDVLDDLSDGGIGGGAVVRVSGEGLLDLLFTGNYPALTYMPFLIAGMAFGRLDLASSAVRVRLAALGGALTVLGYGGSWLAFQLLPGAMGETGSPAAWWSDVDGDPSEGAAWLLTAAPHGETTLSLAGGTGAALLVTVAALAAVDRLPRLRRLAVPLIAVGSMSLTAYVAHIVVLLPRGAELPEWPPHILLGFMLAVTVPAFLWSRYFRRGPLEHLVHTASLASRCVR
ncbi:DUF418 domain-containing protein [Actinomadura litoris]|uniref:DUF418 domain-containing protein n=1 Tax=Actinomadura litoris TaxID=2678616 RepID=UPI001FA767BA|nr:DUF418 domain-containing protein [Actinomadura litoris]